MNYVEVVEVVTSQHKYIVETYGMSHSDGYYYFYTPNGTKRIKSNNVRITYLGKKLCLGAQIAGAVLGASTGVVVGKMTANYVVNSIAPHTPVGRITSAIFGVLTGFSVQSITTPVFQDATAKFIDKGAMMLSSKSNTNSVNNSNNEFESVNN